MNRVLALLGIIGFGVLFLVTNLGDWDGPGVYAPLAFTPVWPKLIQLGEFLGLMTVAVIVGLACYGLYHSQKALPRPRETQRPQGPEAPVADPQLDARLQADVFVFHNDYTTPLN